MQGRGETEGKKVAHPKKEFNLSAQVFYYV